MSPGAERFPALLELLERGEYAQAEPLLRRHISRHPADLAAQELLGTTLLRLGNAEQGAFYLEWPAKSKSAKVGCVLAYAGALCELGRLPEAAEQAARAVEREPASIPAQSILLRSLLGQRRFADAIDAGARALEVIPDSPELMSLYSMALGALGMGEEAMEWAEAASGSDPDDAELARRLCVRARYVAGIDAARLDAMRARADRALGETQPIEVQASPVSGHRRLRVGLLSPDLRATPVGRLASSLLIGAPADRVDFFVYDTGPTRDATGLALARHARAWHEVALLSPESLNERIAKDRLDVLLDLCGQSGGSRLGALSPRVASLQVSALGSIGETGSSRYDARLADAVLCPEPDARVIRVAHAFCLPAPGGVPEPQIPVRWHNPQRRDPVLGLVGDPARLTDATLALVARVMLAIPRASLVVRGLSLSEPRNAGMIARRFARFGIGASRVSIRGEGAAREHLQAYGELDILLDTTPHSGLTTVFEALWMGVPCVTLSGSTEASRLGASVLAAGGLAGLITGDEREFVAKVRDLAADHEQLEVMRTRLRPHVAGSRLCDARVYAESVLDALGGALAARCSFAEPKPIAKPAPPVRRAAGLTLDVHHAA